ASTPTVLFKITLPPITLLPPALLMLGVMPSPLKTNIFFQMLVVLRKFRAAPGWTCNVAAGFPMDVVPPSTASTPPLILMSAKAGSTTADLSQKALLPIFVRLKGFAPVLKAQEGASFDPPKRHGPIPPTVAL